jgi:iron(II)-dependent oxidoreductase
VLDLAGNVAEWTSDRADVFGAGLFRDPIGPAEGHARVVRGGAFDSDPSLLRADTRVAVDADEARYDTGFRCAHSGRASPAPAARGATRSPSSSPPRR